MKITDEMVKAAVHAWQEAGAADHWEPTAGMQHVLRQVAPLIVAAFGQELLGYAWSGHARGAIRGAIEQYEEAQEAPPLGYRPAHEARER